MEKLLNSYTTQIRIKIPKVPLNTPPVNSSELVHDTEPLKSPYFVG